VRWFLGDGLAIIALVPAFLFAAQGRFRRPLVSAGELTALAVSLIFGSWLAFWYADRAATYTPLFLYAPIPALVWAAVRVGPAGVSISLAFMVLFALAGAEVGHGPFAAYGPVVNQLAVQLFLSLLAVPLTALTLLIDERRAAQQALAWSERQLQDQNIQLRTLAGRLMTAHEDERQRISRGLHDDIGQRLALIATAIDRVNLARHEPPAIVESGLQGIRTEVHELASDLHGLSRELYSSTVQHLGLAGALRNWCTQMAAQHHLAIVFIENGHDGIPRDASMCLYRVAQEAVKNAIAHSGAERVTIELTSDFASMRLRVKDLGVGFDPGAPTRGIGLASLRERLRFIGGALSVTSTPGSGAEVMAEIPVT
jgi:two-component system sensor histidine kinase UhpB